MTRQPIVFCLTTLIVCVVLLTFVLRSSRVSLKSEITHYLQDMKRSVVADKGVEETMRQFRRQEVDSAKTFIELDTGSMTEDQAMLETYKYLSFPLQGVCRTTKRIGGVWTQAARKDSPNTQEVDGDKFVCLDNIIDSKQNECLIYSFGVNNDWTFEDHMDYAGCHIFAYDHTVNFPDTRGRNIKFFKKGLGKEENMETLANLYKINKHEGRTVEYLKIDIEGHELGGLSDWLATGALDNVNQIAMELHLPSLHNPSRFKWLLEALQEMNRKNFRLISHEVNMLMGPGVDGFYNFMEVVFMKDNKWNYLDQS